jgi:hypothetical protein
LIGAKNAVKDYFLLKGFAKLKKRCTFAPRIGTLCAEIEE